jgi:hypothetical protein
LTRSKAFDAVPEGKKAKDSMGAPWFMEIVLP